MEEITTTDIPENIENNEIIDETTTDNPPDNNDTTELAQALLEELKTLSQEEQSADESPEQVEETQETYETIDYTEQLNNIISQLDTISTNSDGIYQSILNIETSVQSQPDDIRSTFQDVTDFQYLVLSLEIGLLIALLFFWGLKK